MIMRTRVREFIEMGIFWSPVQDPCSHYVCIFKEYARATMTEANNKRNIHENKFFKILCISNYMLFFLTLMLS